jgi:hypothetical protein
VYDVDVTRLEFSGVLAPFRYTRYPATPLPPALSVLADHDNGTLDDVTAPAASPDGTDGAVVSAGGGVVPAEWQLAVPESEKLLPAIGMNCQS